jgi:hypothetical protein
MRGKVGRVTRFMPAVPTNFSGLTGWWDASDSATLFDATSGGSAVAADGSVARIEDKSGNGRHFTQSTNANRPLRKTGVKNALDALRFDGSNDRLVSSWSSTDLLLTSAFTVFVVAKATSVDTDSTDASSNEIVFGDFDDVMPFSSSAGFVSLRSNGTAVAYGEQASPSSQKKASVSYTAGDWALFTARHNGTTLSFSKNGGTPDETSMTGRSYWGQKMIIGANWLQAQFFDGDVGEIIAYDVALSADDSGSLNSYLIDKWGI